ncbi:MAG: phosphatase PAP2 family protein [Pirellulaceae bacterium]
MNRTGSYSSKRRQLFMAAVIFTGMAVLIWMLFAIPETARLVQTVDDWWHDLMVDLEWAPLVGVAKVFSIVGSVWVMLPLFLLIALWLGIRDQWYGLKVWLVAVIPSQLISAASKLLYARPRPDDRLVDPTTWSFPSGHSTQAAVLGICLALILAPPGRRRVAWLTIAVVYALIMGWTRTYLRVHWSSDVVGGLLLGTSCALWAVMIVRGPPQTEKPGDVGNVGLTN